MKRNRSKVFLCAGVIMAALVMPYVPKLQGTATTTESVDSRETTVKEATYTENTSDIVLAGAVQEKETGIYTGIAVGIADEYLEVYSEPSVNADVVGRLFTDNVAEVEETSADWTKIVSGNLEGFVETASLCFGDEAQAIGGDMTATVMSDTAIVYSVPAETEVLITLDNGDELPAIGRCGDFMIVATDSGEGYVIDADMSLNYNLSFGMTSEEIAEAEAAAAEAARKAEEARLAKIEAAMQSVEVTYNPTMSVSESDVWILACVIDWEAAWESYEGKLAVANVVLNRIRSTRYPSTIPGVVYARAQFSGVSDGAGGPSTSFQARLSSGPRNSDCLKAAMEALSGTNNVGNYTAFRPSYSVALETLSSFTIIGSHVFY